MKRAEALYALGETSKGHLHEEHASLHYGFGTKGNFLDRLKPGKKKPSREITPNTQSTAESVWQKERLLLEGKLSKCENQLESCKDDLESQIRLNNSNMTRQSEMADKIAQLEKSLKNEPTTDPKLTVMQETDTKRKDMRSADSEPLTMEELQEYKVHPNMRY